MPPGGIGPGPAPPPTGSVPPGQQPPGQRPPEQVPPGPIEEQVIEVRVVGNRHRNVQEILGLMKTKVGRPFDAPQLQRDVKTLMSKGWFVDVKPRRDNVPGGVIITMEVVERAILEYVKFLGNKKVPKGSLAKQVDLKKGSPLDPYMVDEGKRKLEDYYKTKGFNGVQVTILEGTKLNDRGAIYLIHEGPSQKIKVVHFVGNTIASEGRLRTQIHSKPPILWVFGGIFDRKKLDEDMDKLTAYYRGLGFFKARIGREITDNPEQDKITVTWVIDEGPRYKVRDVRLLGNTKFTTPQLQEHLTLKGSEFFDQAKMSKDVSLIRDIYGGQGYIFADVQAEQRFLEEPGTLDLVYNLKEGDRYRVSKINVHIEGDNPHTRSNTVLNRLSLRPGDIIDLNKLRQSERRLKASQLFLTDPTKGTAPKIVFSPPEGEDDDSAIATRPRRRGGSSSGSGSGNGFRGQSPDGQPPEGAADDEQLPRWKRIEVELEPIVERPALAPPRGGGGGFFSVPSEPVTDEEGSGKPVASQPAGAAAAKTTAPPRPAAANGAQARGTGAGSNHRTAQPRNRSFGPSATPVPWIGFSTIMNSTPRSYNGFWPKSLLEHRSLDRSVVYRGQSPGGSTIVDPAVQPVQYGGPIPGAGNPGAGPAGAAPPGMGLPGAAGSGPGVLPPPGVSPDGSQPIYETPDRYIPLDVYTHETQTGRFQFGAGVNSNSGLIGSITINESNFDWQRVPTSWEDWRNGTAFRGAGQRFNISLSPGQYIQNYSVSFQEPYLFDTLVSYGMSGNYFMRYYRDWTETRAGGRVSLGYQFTPDLGGNVAIRGENVRISNPSNALEPELARVLGNSQLYTVGGTLVYDTRDNTFLATEGLYIQGGIEEAFGTFSFPRGTLDVRKFFTLRQRPDGSGRHVFTVSGLFGIEGNNAPLYEHFFAGGIGTIEGFQYRGASPMDLGVEVGGTVEALGRVEYMLPVTADDMLRLVAFCDAGVVEQKFEYQPQSLRVAPGLGVRVTLPALGPAPIAFDVAIPVVRNPNDILQYFQFFVGFGR